MHSYHIPRAILHLEGFDINTFFSETVMIGIDPTAMVEAVRNGDVDVGVGFAMEDMDILQWMATEDPAIFEELKIIDYTPWIPERGIAASPAIDVEMQSRLASALVAASNSPAGKDALSGIDGIKEFVAPDDNFLEVVELIRWGNQLDEDFGTW